LSPAKWTEPVMRGATTDWESKFCKKCALMTSSAIREILKVAQQPEVISFAGGLPAPEIFPVKEIEESCVNVLRTAGEQALQYGITEGFPALRQELAVKMHKYGVEAEPENIFLTNGSQQALDLIGRVFIDPGDVIVTDSPVSRLFPSTIMASRWIVSRTCSRRRGCDSCMSFPTSTIQPA
jgi:DNA-binding transcriptional MocR family regulator